MKCLKRKLRDPIESGCEKGPNEMVILSNLLHVVYDSIAVKMYMGHLPSIVLAGHVSTVYTLRLRVLTKKSSNHTASLHQRVEYHAYTWPFAIMWPFAIVRRLMETIMFSPVCAKVS